MLAYRLVAAAPGRYSQALGRRATCIGALAIVGMAAALCVSSADAATVSPSGAVGVPPVLEVGVSRPGSTETFLFGIPAHYERGR